MSFGSGVETKIRWIFGHTYEKIRWMREDCSQNPAGGRFGSKSTGFLFCERALILQQRLCIRDVDGVVLLSTGGTVYDRGAVRDYEAPLFDYSGG